jgi:uncharacterized protein YndB with AHSA1/START domain
VAEYETEIDIEAPPEVVFRHLTESDLMVTWMGQHAVLEAHAGGRFEVDCNGVPLRGSFVTVEPPTRVVFSWGVAGNDEIPAGSTRVEVTLEATTAGTHLRLVHSQLPEQEAPKHDEGWSHFLPRLATAAAGRDPGPDPWASEMPTETRG